MKNEKIKALSLKSNEKIKALSLKSPKFDKLSFSKKKVVIFQDMITNTILAIQAYKTKDIIGASELNVCIQGLESLYNELDVLNIMLQSGEKNVDFNDIITRLQKINNELSSIFRNFGTQDIEDLITVAFATDFIDKTITEDTVDKWEIIKKYVHQKSYC